MGTCLSSSLLWKVQFGVRDLSFYVRDLAFYVTYNRDFFFPLFLVVLRLFSAPGCLKSLEAHVWGCIGPSSVKFVISAPSWLALATSVIFVIIWCLATCRIP